MMAVFEIAARQGYAVARGIVKDLAAVPDIPLLEAWPFVLCRLRPGDLKDSLAPDEETKWRRVIETEICAAKERDLPAEMAESLLAEVLAGSRMTTAEANLRRWLRLIEE